MIALDKPEKRLSNHTLPAASSTKMSRQTGTSHSLMTNKIEHCICKKRRTKKKAKSEGVRMDTAARELELLNGHRSMCTTLQLRPAELTRCSFARRTTQNPTSLWPSYIQSSIARSWTLRNCARRCTISSALARKSRSGGSTTDTTATDHENSDK
jgi:hypothetical protein